MAVLEGPLGDSLARGSFFIAGQATALRKVLQGPRCEFFSRVRRKPESLTFVLVSLSTWKQENVGFAAHAFILCVCT